MFPSLFDHPQKIRFENQEEDEVIDLFLRKHGIVNVPWIVISIVLSLVPFFIPSFLAFLQISLALVPNQILIGALVIWYLLILAYIIENFLFWYFNIYIVTNIHLVDINFVSILNRNIVEIQLVDIEAQRPKIRGIIRGLFNFGDVVIETAAEKLKIEFIDVPRPDFVADRIQDLSEKNGAHNGS